MADCKGNQAEMNACFNRRVAALEAGNAELGRTTDNLTGRVSYLEDHLKDAIVLITKLQSQIDELKKRPTLGGSFRLIGKTDIGKVDGYLKANHDHSVSVVDNINDQGGVDWRLA